MPAGEDSPQTNPIFAPASLEQQADVPGNMSRDSRSADWKAIASAAAGTMLGVPFVPSGTFRAVWVEFSQWIAALQK